jgi:uncharacterized protein YfaS (alpha-2-macroglobulin family)
MQAYLHLRLALPALAAVLVGCELFAEDPATKEVVPTVAVVASEPRGLITETRPVRVRFSEAVARPEQVGRPAAVDEVLVITPELEGRGRWIAPDTFELLPLRELAPNTRYAVRVRERTAGPGRRLVGPRRFTFHTPLFRVLSARGHRQGAALRATLELSHAVRTDDALGAVSFRDRDGRVLAARLLGTGAQRILRFALPASGVDPEAGVEVRVEPTLAPRGGGLALDKAVVAHLSFDPPATPELLSHEVVVGDEGPAVQLRFNTEVDPVRARPYVLTGGPGGASLVAEHQGLRITGLTPGARHRVVLRAGLPTAAGPLLDEHIFDVELPALAPRLAFEGQDGLLSSVSGNLYLTAVNVARLHVRAVRVPDRNIAHVELRGHRSLESLGQAAGELDLEGVQREDQLARLELPLQDILRGGGGLYRIEVEDADRAWVRAEGWLLQHGLLLTAKVGAGYVRAKVEAGQSGRPSAGARVSAYSRTGKKLFAVATSAAGVAEHRGPVDPEDPVAWLVAEHGAAAAYLPMEESLVPMAEAQATPHAPAFLALDRDYYRPGEGVHAVALVERGTSLGVLRAELVGPGGPVGEVGPLAFDPRGILNVQVDLPLDAAPGDYALRLLDAAGAEVGAAGLWVASPYPEPLEVTVRPAEGVAPGRSIPFVVAVRSRFGARTQGFRVEGRCRYTSVPLEGIEQDGFHFGLQDGAARGRAAEVLLPPGQVGEGGEARVACPAPPAEMPPGRAVEVDLRASVFEPGARAVTRRGRARAYVAPYAVGLRFRDGRLMVRAVGTDGGAQAGVPLVATLWTAREHGERWLVAREAVTSAAGPVDVTFQPPQAGRYRAEVEAEPAGLVASLDFWVLTGTAAASVPHAEVILPEGPHAVGSTVQARVRVPAPGRLHLSVERGQVLYERTVEVPAGQQTVELPVLAAFAPNARVVAQLRGPAGLRAYGAAPLFVAVAERHLQVQVDLPEGSAGQRFLVRIQAQGPLTRPRAIVMLTAADRLAESTARWDPFPHFFARQPVGVSTHDPAWFEERAAAAPAPLPMQEVLPRPEQVPPASGTFVSPPVELSPRGLGLAAARWPEGVGRGLLRVVVFDDGAYGVGTLRLEAGAGPAAALAAPATLTQGDRLQVGLSVENPGGEPWTATASAAVEGGLALRGAARLELAVPPGRTREAELTVEAVSAGPGRLRLQVDAAGARAEASAPLEVRSVFAPRASGVAGEAGHGAPLRLVPPDAAAEGEATLVVGPGALFRHATAWRGLAGGRPGELAALVAKGLALVGAPALTGLEPDADLELQAVMQQLGRATGSDLRLTRWEGGPNAPPELEVQAGLLGALIARGRLSGLEERAARGLARRLEVLAGDPAAATIIRARAALALALSGARPEVPAEWTVAGVPAEVRVPAAAARALAGGGLAALSGPVGPVKGSEALAWVALALAEAAPAHPELQAVLTQLEAAAGPTGWGTPGADAVALVALARADRVRGAERPYWGAVVVGGEIVKRFNSGRPILLQAPARAWAEGVELTITGAGRAQATLTRVGPPPGPPAPGGLEVSRTYRSAADGAPMGAQAGLGQIFVVEVALRAPGDAGAVLVRVPIAAGLVVEEIWPAKVLEGAPVGQVTRTPEGLVWRLVPGPEPARLVYTVRAVRSGRFTDPPVEAWRAEDPRVGGHAAPAVWTVERP